MIEKNLVGYWVRRRSFFRPEYKHVPEFSANMYCQGRLGQMVSVFDPRHCQMIGVGILSLICRDYEGRFQNIGCDFLVYIFCVSSFLCLSLCYTFLVTSRCLSSILLWRMTFKSYIRIQDIIDNEKIGLCINDTRKEEGQGLVAEVKRYWC